MIKTNRKRAIHKCYFLQIWLNNDNKNVLNEYVEKEPSVGVSVFIMSILSNVIMCVLSFPTAKNIKGIFGVLDNGENNLGILNGTHLNRHLLNHLEDIDI